MLVKEKKGTLRCLYPLNSKLKIGKKIKSKKKRSFTIARLNLQENLEKIFIDFMIKRKNNEINKITQ